MVQRRGLSFPAQSLCMPVHTSTHGAEQRAAGAPEGHGHPGKHGPGAVGTLHAPLHHRHHEGTRVTAVSFTFPGNVCCFFLWLPLFTFCRKIKHKQRNRAKHTSELMNCEAVNLLRWALQEIELLSHPGDSVDGVIPRRLLCSPRSW